MNNTHSSSHGNAVSGSDTHPSHSTAPRIDNQTGLPNREALLCEIQQRVLEADRYFMDLSTMIVAIDRFFEFVEKGDPAVESVLARVTGVLRKNLRATDLISRCGDGRFAVILPHSNMQQVLIPALRTQQQIQHPDQLANGKPRSLTSVSIGIAQLDREESHASLLSRVESALNAASLAGPSGLYVHDVQSCVNAKNQAMDLAASC